MLNISDVADILEKPKREVKRLIENWKLKGYKRRKIEYRRESSKIYFKKVRIIKTNKYEYKIMREDLSKFLE